jgi:tRNA U34 2-thiouridine synthase MnmA/TrmU
VKIAVGLSGGVDSSVAAAVLASQGHEVIGVTMKLWRDGRYRGGDKDACFGPGEAEDIARRAGIAFDRFATGHYARIREDGGVFRLLRGTDGKKDQSYFLYRLKQSQLANLLFPLGAYRKNEVRELAAKYGLEVKDQPDSQDFYSGDFGSALRRFRRRRLAF